MVSWVLLHALNVIQCVHLPEEIWKTNLATGISGCSINNIAACINLKAKHVPNKPLTIRSVYNSWYQELIVFLLLLILSYQIATFSLCCLISNNLFIWNEFIVIDLLCNILSFLMSTIFHLHLPRWIQFSKLHHIFLIEIWFKVSKVFHGLPSGLNFNSNNHWIYFLENVEIDITYSHI